MVEVSIVEKIPLNYSNGSYYANVRYRLRDREDGIEITEELENLNFNGVKELIVSFYNSVFKKSKIKPKIYYTFTREGEKIVGVKEVTLKFEELDLEERVELSLFNYTDLDSLLLYTIRETYLALKRISKHFEGKTLSFTATIYISQGFCHKKYDECSGGFFSKKYKVKWGVEKVRLYLNVTLLDSDRREYQIDVASAVLISGERALEIKNKVMKVRYKPNKDDIYVVFLKILRKLGFEPISDFSLFELTESLLIQGRLIDSECRELRKLGCFFPFTDFGLYDKGEERCE